MNTSGGAGEGSGRSCGFRLAQAMAEQTRSVTSPGLRRNQAGGTYHGRGSQPVIAVGTKGRGLVSEAWPHLHRPASARIENGCSPLTSPNDQLYMPTAS